jgi:hypothetical protein
MPLDYLYRTFLNDCVIVIRHYRNLGITCEVTIPASEFLPLIIRIAPCITVFAGSVVTLLTHLLKERSIFHLHSFPG